MIFELACEPQRQCYVQYASVISSEQGKITVDTIYPATDKHISKHSAQTFVMVSVTLQANI